MTAEAHAARTVTLSRERDGVALIHLNRPPAHAYEKTLADDLNALPQKGDKLFKNEKEVGYITSAIASPALKANIALGYVRRETNHIGAQLALRTSVGPSATNSASIAP